MNILMLFTAYSSAPFNRTHTAIMRWYTLSIAANNGTWVHRLLGKSNPAAPLACPAGQLLFACGACLRGLCGAHSVHTTLCMGSV
eukprot:4040496-Amphidinium_carterae.1